MISSYVNPNWGVQARREALREWNWGECSCERCVREAKLVESVKEPPKPAVESPQPRPDIDPVEVEKELKEALGF